MTAATLGDEKYVLITTYKRDGTGVATPVWSVPLDGDRFGFSTSSGSGKAKRLAHTDRVVVQPCDQRGRVRADSRPVDATARLVTGDELETIRAGLRRKYGMMVKVAVVYETVVGFLKRHRTPAGDRGVIVSPAAPREPTPG